ncbi:MAG: hypothetical protein IKD66_07335, partial [Solobacterium sp.]|nr:hypothetical protein [Solobacterium sp.]
KNPTETVIINVCRETGTEDMSRDEQIALVNKRLKEHFDRYKDIIYGNGVFTGIPTMGECRGKVVVLSENPDKVGYGTNYWGAWESSSVDDGSRKPMMNIAGHDFYYENHYGALEGDKENWIRSFYNELGGEALPIDPNNHLDHGILVQSSSNVILKDTPEMVANYINPILYTGKNALFKKRGIFNGWVLSDFVTAETAKTLWITNFPECVHDMNVFEVKPAT